MDGWIKLHRRLLGWEWHKDANTLSVFIHLLLLAAHKPHEVDGITLEAGQVLTSRWALVKLTGLGEQKVRTALKHLQLTNEITKQQTKQQTIITICKWESYQAFFAEPNQATNQATNQQYNNVYIQELGVKGACVRACEDSAALIEQLRSQLQTSPLKQEELQRSTRLPLADALRLADEVFSDWAFQDEPPSGITLAHLLAVIRIKAERERQQPQDLQTWKQQEAARANQELSAYFSQINSKN